MIPIVIFLSQNIVAFSILKVAKALAHGRSPCTAPNCLTKIFVCLRKLIDFKEHSDSLYGEDCSQHHTTNKKMTLAVIRGTVLSTNSLVQFREKRQEQ